MREFVTEAFQYAGLDWSQHVKLAERYLRPLEVEFLLADPRKAREKLHWKPQVTFRELVAIMVDADMEAVGLTPPGKGKRILQAKLGHWHQWRNSVTQAVQAVVGRASE